jgi:hypothetical protein
MIRTTNAVELDGMEDVFGPVKVAVDLLISILTSSVLIAWNKRIALSPLITAWLLCFASSAIGGWPDGDMVWELGCSQLE